MSQQVVTISLFRFEGLSNKWWAFGEMGKRAFIRESEEGIITDSTSVLKPDFIKMFGAGSGNGFSLMPDFGVYGLLATWSNLHQAQLFFQHSATFKAYQSRSKEIFTVFLRPIMAHGKWDGAEPFVTSTVSDASLPIAVLTRGTVKTRYIWDFLSFTRTTSRSMEGAEGRLFSIGIGEVPIVQQATFSLWHNVEAMKNYAYKNKHHAEVVKKTRELGWYSEELFARFEVINTEFTDLWLGGGKMPFLNHR